MATSSPVSSPLGPAIAPSSGNRFRFFFDRDALIFRPRAITHRRLTHLQPATASQSSATYQRRYPRIRTPIREFFKKYI
jgi:hypothetical protein